MERISLAKEKLDALDDEEDAPIEELKKIIFNGFLKIQQMEGVSFMHKT